MDLFRQLHLILRKSLQIKLSISSSHIILTPGHPVPFLTPNRQAPSGIATDVSIFVITLSAVREGLEPRSAALDSDALPLGQRRRDGWVMGLRCLVREMTGQVLPHE